VESSLAVSEQSVETDAKATAEAETAEAQAGAETTSAIAETALAEEETAPTESTTSEAKVTLAPQEAKSTAEEEIAAAEPVVTEALTAEQTPAEAESAVSAPEPVPTAAGPVVTEALTAEQTSAEAEPAVSAPEPVPTAPQPAPEATTAAVAEQTSAEKPKRKKRRKRRKKARAAMQVRVIPRKRVVKPLAVGMELHGTVKRIADFGAFVDIGVGTDGLVHISELSQVRVNKVSDVVSEGQEVTVWIKELDRDNNRISLTMLPPGTKTIRDLNEDEIVAGTVTRLAPYGAFVDIGVGREALLHIREMSERFVRKPEDVVQVGEPIEARIVKLDRRRGRIDLSLKGLRPEPEPEPEPESEPEKSNYSWGEDEDDMPTLMELALREAMGDEFEQFKARSRRSRRGSNRRRRSRKVYREEQDEIIERTLYGHRG